MSSPGRSPLGAGASLTLVLLLYATAAALLPLAHHDVVCHLKSSTHCTTCVIGSSAESAFTTSGWLVVRLIDLGSPAAAALVRSDSLPLGPSAGRAPPCLA